ncbi:flagellar protein [Caloramator sp. E03]|nr:flagellar protein [Caloramator sp. E03]
MINRIENNNINSYDINKKINKAIEFSKILEKVEVNKELKFSAHAMDRLRDRNINLTEKDIENLKSAVEKIKSKGGKDALILYNNIAFITSIRNNTIITAVDNDNIKENVFTNIDSAMIL